MAFQILESTNTKLPEVAPDNHRDILLHNFCQNGTNSIADVHMINSDALAYDVITLKKCLSKHEHKEKKNNAKSAWLKGWFLHHHSLVLTA